MESPTAAKKALTKVWDDLTKHFNAEADRDRLFSQQLIDEPTMDKIQSAKSKKEANRAFLTHLQTNASTESLMKFCRDILRRHDTPQSDHPYVYLATKLEKELQWNPEDHIEPNSVRIAPSGSNGPRQAMVAGNSVGYLASRPSAVDLRYISCETGKDWKDLLRFLEIKEPRIATFVNDNPNNTAEACYQGLVFWENENALLPVTWDTLKVALKKANLTKLANELPQKRNSTPHSGHSQLGQISSCQPPSTARQDTSPSDPRKTNYRFAIMVANDNELHATMHFLCSKYRWSEVKEDVQSYTCEGDEKLKGAITTEEQFRTQGKNKLNIFPITVDEIPGIVVKCGNMGSFTQMGSHRTTLQLMKEATEGGWDLKTIFIVGCCGTLPETETNVEEQHYIGKAKKAKTEANIFSNPTVHHNKPNERVPLGTVLVAREIIQYAGKLEDGRTDWKMECCFKPDQFVDFEAVQYSDVRSDACRIVEKVIGATFLSADFVIKCEYTALELAKLHRRLYVGFEMEGVGATKAIDDALIFQPAKPEVVLVKGVSHKAKRYKNKEAYFQFFSGELTLRTEDSRQQMCTIMSLTLVLKYIIQNKANVYQ